jgi:hypothetical protein
MDDPTQDPRIRFEISRHHLGFPFGWVVDVYEDGRQYPWFSDLQCFWTLAGARRWAANPTRRLRLPYRSANFGPYGTVTEQVNR